MWFFDWYSYGIKSHITVIVYPKAVGRTNFEKIVELCYVENIRIMKKKCVCVCVCTHVLVYPQFYFVSCIEKLALALIGLWW